MKAGQVLILGLAFAISSCADMLNFPQTREEFVRNPKVLNETYTVARPLDAVVASLAKAKRCTDDETVQQKMAGSMIAASHDIHYMTVDKTSPKRAEMTYRWASNNMVGMPKGGYYVLAADLQAQSAKTTTVTLYGSNGKESRVRAVREWTRGNDQDCHHF